MCVDVPNLDGTGKENWLMKKLVIYLLMLMMVLSPVTAFAGEGDPVGDEGQGQVPAEEMQDQDSEVPEETAPAEDAEEVKETAPASEKEVVEIEKAEPAVPVAEDADTEEVQEVYLKAAPGSDDLDTYEWEDETYTKAYKLNGQGEKEYAKGVFKAKRYKTGETTPDGTSLFYADSNGNVAHEEKLVD